MGLDRDPILDALTLGLVAVGLAQLALYWKLYYDMVKKRDEFIEYELEFLDKLEELKLDALPILEKRRAIIGELVVPAANVCAEATRYAGEVAKDSARLDNWAQDMSTKSCQGIPNGWSLHEGMLAGALAVGTSGSLLSGESKRREEKFRYDKTGLVMRAQQGMKAVFKANDILAQYARAAAIYSGLTDLFIQGFNSAGAGLGAALDKLGSGMTDVSGGSGPGGSMMNSPIKNVG